MIQNHGFYLHLKSVYRDTVKLYIRVEELTVVTAPPELMLGVGGCLI